MRSIVPTTVRPVPGARPGSASACRMLAGISVPMPRPITPNAATVASGDEVASAAAVASPPTAAPVRATARSPKRVTAGSPSSRPTVWQVCSAMKPSPPTAAAAPRSSRRYSALHAAPTSSTDCAQAATVPSARQAQEQPAAVGAAQRRRDAAPRVRRRHGRAVGVVRSGQQAASHRDRHDGQQRGHDGEVDDHGRAERHGQRAHRRAGDGADAPDGVQRVQDRAAVAPLDAQGVRVVRDVGHGVERAGDEQRERQREPDRRGADEHQVGRDDERADGCDDRGAPAGDERAAGQADEQRAEAVRPDGRPERGPREVEAVLDLGVARDDVGVERAVGEEQGPDGGARRAGPSVSGARDGRSRPRRRPAASRAGADC